MGGMGKAIMYSQAISGTKQLIVNYVDEIVETLELLASPEVDDITLEEKIDFFRRAHHCCGRSALMMSGSGMLLFFHMGVVKALAEQHLLPDILSGSSGGAIVGSFVCTHSDEEITEKLNAGNMIELIGQVAETIRGTGKRVPRVLQQDDIKMLLDEIIPDMTFQESYQATGRMMNVSVAAAEQHQTSRLLNATTSPNVLMRRAALATAAVPGIYPPVALEARDSIGAVQAYLPSREWVDGSVSDDLPAKRLARLYGVNHYIVSQTNPHVIPFVSDGKRSKSTQGILTNAFRRSTREWMNAGAMILEKPLRRYKPLGRMTNVAMSVINQDYMGDINILPPSRFYNPFNLLSLPSDKFISDRISDGERKTWEKIEMIRVQTKMNRTLDKIIADFQDGLVKKRF
jgi:NTE family protein